MKKTISRLLMMTSLCLPLVGHGQELQMKNVPSDPEARRAAILRAIPQEERSTVKYRVTLLRLKPDAPLAPTGVLPGRNDSEEKVDIGRYADTLAKSFVSTKNETTFFDTQSIRVGGENIGYNLELTPIMDRRLFSAFPLRITSVIKYTQRLPAKEINGREQIAVVSANPLMEVGDVAVHTWSNGGDRFALVLKLTDAARETAEAIDDAAPKTGT